MIASRRTLKSIGILAGLGITVFILLYALLPPSLILTIGTTVIGLVVALILIRVGWLKWLTGLITLSIVAAVSLIVVLVMTNTSSVGVVMDEPPLPEIDAFLQDQGFSGAVLIAQDDQILLNKGYGYADRNRMTLNTPQARFPIGSVTKQFTAMAILMLQAEGKLNLQDPVCEYIADCPAAWREVTLYHLLTNSSGIPDFFVPCFSNSQDFEEAITEAVGQPLQFQPGEQYSYSNVGYHLLGEVIEQVSGQPYGEFLQRAIFTPLGMKDTGFEDEGYQTVGYVNAFLRACPFELSALGSEGGLYSTVEDMYRWDQALYTDQLIAQALLDEMFTAHVRMPDKFLGGELGYGYGWAVGQQFGRRMVMHGGLIYGFTSVIVRYPDDRLAVIILSNQQNYSGGTLTAGVLQRVAQEMLDEE